MSTEMVRQNVVLLSLGYAAFDRQLAEQARDGFALIRLVPVDGFSSVAVWERIPDRPAGSDGGGT